MLQPKSYIAELIPAIHGGMDYTELRKLGISPEKVLDFSVNTNPFGPPPLITSVINQKHIDRYPDSEATDFSLALAEKLRVTPSNIIIGGGSTELIRLITMTYLGYGDIALIPQPTYAEYEVASKLVGARIIAQKLSRETGFQLDVKKTLELILEHKPGIIFLCNPNNPTGQYLSQEQVEQILLTATDSLVVLDEAYINFTDNLWESTSLIDRGNIIILRSMTKDYALAGLRLGYALAAEPVISMLKKVRPPWNVNIFAQAAGVFALSSSEYLETSRQKLKEAKAFLMEGFKLMGFELVPSQTNYFLVRVANAASTRSLLLSKGVLVRDCSSFGLPEYIRVAPRTLPECRRLIAILKELEVAH